MNKETPEQEAERLYPDTKENETVSMGHNGIQDLRRSAHISAARQYMGEIEKLRAENEKMRKALEDIQAKINTLMKEDTKGRAIEVAIIMANSTREILSIATEALKTNTHG